jgi:hypothetical protein
VHGARSERHLGSALRAEEVRGEGEIRAGHVREQEGRAAGGDDPPVDLGRLQVPVDGRFDDGKVSVPPELLDEAAEVAELQVLQELSFTRGRFSSSETP